MTRWILKNKHAVWPLVLAVGVFGYLAYRQLPVQLFPDTAPPLVNIITTYPGAAAEDVAQDLSRRMEEEFAALEGVFKVKSSSQDNLSVVSVEFQYDRDVDLAAVDVQNAIARIRGELPPGIREPQVLKFSTTDRPVVTYAVTGEDLPRVRKLAEDDFAPRLQQVSGVAAVDVFGGSRPAVLVELDRYELEAARVPLQRVVEALRAHNAMTPAGRIRTESTQSMFRVDTRADTASALEDIPIATGGGSRVLLGDLATIRKAPLEDDSRFRLDGRQAIAMQVFKTTEANTVEVVQATRQAIDAIRSSYPGVEIREGEESASFAQTSVDNLMGNIGQAILFTAVLMLFFLRQWRTSLVVALTMPLSFGITFAVMKLLNIDLNLVTLSAIILAVGIVIDNSVVVLENIVRRREQDQLGPEDGAAVGADEVRGAALGGSLTNIAVLVPLLFLSGFTGKTFGPLSLTLLIAFSSSIVVALVLVPLFSTYVKSQTGGKDIGNRVVHLVSTPFNWAMDRLRRFYLLLLRGSLRHRWVIAIAAVVLFGGGIAGIRALGMDVLPKMDTGSFYVSLQTPSGSSLEETERVVRDVEELIRKEKEVQIIQSQVGFEQGMRSLSSFGVQGPTQGFITVTLTDRDQRTDTVWDIESRIREGIAKVPGIEVATVREMGNTARATTSAPVVVRITGDDPLVLDKLGLAVEKRLAKVPSIVAPMRSWRIDQRQGRFDVDVLRANQLGVSPVMIGQTVLAGTDGLTAGDYSGDSGTPLPIQVSFREEQRQTPDDLLRFPLFTPWTLDPIPLGELARHREVLGQGLVTREHLSPSLEVSAFIEGRPLSFVASDVEKALLDIEPPAGYRVEVTGEKGDLAESKSEIGMALFIGIIAVYLLLVAQFRSFVHPITVLSSIPLSLSGIAAALFLAGKPVSMPVMVGLILIVGMVINSAILLISFIEQQRERGVSVEEALTTAVDLRFRPIMMTSLSTIVGMIPLAAEWSLGAERFSPLAIAVIGGFTTATFLTIIFIPVLYSTFESGIERLKRVFKSRGLAATSTSIALVVLLFPGVLNAQEKLSIDLPRSIEMALTHNHKTGMRQDEVEAAVYRRKQATGRFLPRLSLSARYSRVSHVEPGMLELPLQLPDGSSPEPVQLGEAVDNQYSLRLTVDQPLFTGFRLYRGFVVADRSEDLAKERLRAQKADVRVLTQEAYFNLLKARQMAEVAAQSERTLAEHLQRVRLLHESGRATDLDVSRVQNRLANAQVSVVQSRGAVNVAQLALTTLIGVPSTTELTLADVFDESSLQGAPPAPALVSEALEARPEVAIARHAAKIADARADAEGAGLWPQISFRFGYNYDRPNQRYFPVRNQFDGSWDLSLLLYWTIWDWGVTYHGMMAARAEASAASRNVDDIRESVRLDVEQRREQYVSVRGHTNASRQAVNSAEHALEQAKLLFTAGRITSLDVLDAETEATRARFELVQALADARIMWAKVERAVGRGL